jgi:phage-related minor tail protein
VKLSEAFVSIMPQFDPGFDAKLSAETTKAGIKAGGALADSFTKSSDAGTKMTVTKIGTTLKAVTKDADKYGSDAGKKLGDGISNGLKSSTTAVASSVSKTGDKISESLGDSGTKAASKMTTNLESGLEKAKPKVLGIGTAIGVGMVAAFSSKVDLTATVNNFTKQLGVTKTEAAQLGLVAGSVFAEGMTDGMDEVQNAVTAVINNITGIRDQGLPAIKEVTQGALGIAKAFGQDVTQTTRAVGQLMRTGLAKDTTEALDLITAGFQKIPGAAEDLLDTFNEYSVQFKKLGLSGKDALGIISQLMEGGARNTDLAADALKEFSIRAIDGSKAVEGAFKTIGLDADKMARDFSEGGDAARSAFGETLKAINSIKDPLKRNEAGVALFGSQWEDLGDAIGHADLDTAAKGLGKIEGVTNQISTNSFGEKFKANIGKVKTAITVLGGVLGIGLGASFTEALDVSAANAKLTQSLGLNKDKVGEIGKASGSIFSAGFGDSIQDVDAAIATVAQNIPNIAKQGVPALAEVTKGALAISKAFGEDIGNTSQVVAQLIRTGLAKDATEALDLISAGLQKVPKAGEDLMDTFNEYSVQFQKLGLTGPNALGLINQLMLGGARNTDLAADAIKEFSIRAVDGSKLSADGFKALGMDAAKMTATFAKGGPEAQAAFGQVIDALNGMKDPVARNTAGVALFGTQWEDLGNAFKSADLDTAAASLGKIEGANKAITTSTPTDAVKQFTRSIQTAFISIMAEKVIPVVAKFTTLIQGHQGLFKGLAVTALVLAAAYGAVTLAMAAQAAGGFLLFIKGVITSTKLWTAGQWLLNAALDANPIGIVIVAVAALVAAIILLYKNNETVRKAIDAAWKGIKAAFSATIDWFTGTAWPAMKTAFNAIADAATWLWKTILKPAWDGIKSVIDVAWSVIKAIFNAIVAAVKVVADIFTWLWKNIISPVWEGIKTAINIAWVAIKVIFAAVELGIKANAAVWTWLWHNVLEPVWTGIKLAIDIAWKAIEIIFKLVEIGIKALAIVWNWLYDSVIKPMWDKVVAATQAWWNIIKAVWDAVIGFIQGAFAAAWNWIHDSLIKPLWDKVSAATSFWWNALQAIWNAVIGFIKGAFAAAWNWIYDSLIKPVWDRVSAATSIWWSAVQSVWNTVIGFIRGTFSEAWNFLKDKISSIWDSIKSVLSAGWDWIKSKVFDPIKNIITNDIPNAFSTGVSAIGKVWDKLKDVAKIPVKFVIETVLNNGIIAAVNTLASAVGIKGISKVAMPFATGGIYPGYTPGKDIGLAAVSGGEAIMRPEWTRAMGPEFVHGGNAAARGGGINAVKKWFFGWMNRIGGDRSDKPEQYAKAIKGNRHNASFKGRFATGGIVPFAGNYDLGGIVGAVKAAWDTFTDPVGALKKAGDALINTIPGAGAFKDLAKGGATKAFDGIINWVKDKISVKGVAGAQTFVKAQNGKPYVWASAGPGGYDCSGIVSAVYNVMKGKNPYSHTFSTSGEAPFFPLPGVGPLTAGWANPGERGASANVGHTAGNIGGLAFESTGSRGVHIGASATPVQHFAHMGHAKFDQGGWLTPNMVGVNKLGQPEAVLTPAESRGLKGMGTDKLIDKLEELIDAVNDIAPGVGDEINGIGKNIIRKRRTR